jgi:hypothetical protein
MQRDQCTGNVFSEWKVHEANMQQMGFSTSRVLPPSLVTKELGYLFGLRKLAN